MEDPEGSSKDQQPPTCVIPPGPFEANNVLTDGSGFCGGLWGRLEMFGGFLEYTRGPLALPWATLGSPGAPFRDPGGKGELLAPAGWSFL